MCSRRAAVVLLGCLVSPAALAAVSPVPFLLRGEGWEFELDLDPLKGKLTRDGDTFGLRDPKLTELSSSTQSKDLVQTEYRLRFTIDACAHGQQVEQSRWPGLCDYWPGMTRPVRLETFELLLTRSRAVMAGVTTDMLWAACVPQSGLGPSCQLFGSRATLSSGTRTRNGSVVP